MENFIWLGNALLIIPAVVLLRRRQWRILMVVAMLCDLVAAALWVAQARYGSIALGRYMSGSTWETSLAVLSVAGISLPYAAAIALMRFGNWLQWWRNITLWGIFVLTFIVGLLVVGENSRIIDFGVAIMLIIVAFWIGVVVTIGSIALPVVYRNQRSTDRDRRAGLCPDCGYDLRATPNRCPECGKEICTPQAIDRERCKDPASV